MLASTSLSSANLISVYPSTLHKIIRLQFFKFYSQPKRDLSKRINYATKNMISQSSNPAKPFTFTDYDCIGFDLDNTICRYKVGPMMKMEYTALSKYLVDVKKYSPKYLLRPIESDLDFLMKGLILDLENGNILKIDSTGEIVTACHGTKPMTRAEIQKQYGKSRHWPVTDRYVKDALDTWSGPLSTKMRSLLDYFDMPVSLIFARLVDTVDEQKGRGTVYDLWPDVFSGLSDMFENKQFDLEKGGFFSAVKKNPDLYIEKCSDNVIQWLEDFRKHKKILFLATGSHADYATLIAKTCMGDKWSSLFDLVIFQAKKPGFFTGHRAFLSAENQKIIPGNSLIKNGFYVNGNWSDLHNFLASSCDIMYPRVAYVGDNLIQDIYAPAIHTQCDTIAICEELEAEEIFGFENAHSASEYLKSKTWGSFFKGDAENKDSFWMSVMKKYSRVCGPSIEYFASKPVDFEYRM